eukprot:gb/GECG01000002.1/.p1 GENE.gb/GECG01000002.1/~~gb/GECG01000002.1/.p1  ORF type:complete len:256 (+),score=16.36 gb/GECG01000002.1/:1-768(+)
MTDSQFRRIANASTSGRFAYATNVHLRQTASSTRQELADRAKSMVETLSLNGKDQGISPRDGALLLALLELTQCDFIVLSGVHLGSSTKMFADHFKGELVISFDTNTLRKFGKTIQDFYNYPNVLFKIGDGLEVVPRVLGSLRGPFGVFIDGPKCMSALPLVRKAIEQGAKFVAVHDACGCVHAHSRNRQKLQATFLLNNARDPNMTRLLNPQGSINDCFTNPGPRDRSSKGGGGLAVWVPGMCERNSTQATFAR